MFALLVTILGAAGTVFSLNLGVGIAKWLTDAPVEGLRTGNRTNTALSLAALLAGISFPLTVLCMALARPLATMEIDGIVLLVLALSVPLSIAVNALLSVFQGEQRLSRYALLQIGAASAALAVTWIAASLSPGQVIPVALCAFPVAFVVSAMFGFPFGATRTRTFYDPQAIELGRQLLRGGLYFTLSGAIQQGFLTISRAGLLMLSDARTSGLALASWVAVYSILSLLIVPLSKDVLPRLRRSRNNGRVAFEHEATSLGVLVVALVCFVGPLLYWFSEGILSLLYTAEFAAGATFLRLFLAAELLRVVNIYLGYCRIAQDQEAIQLKAEGSISAVALLGAFGLWITGVGIEVCLPLGLLLGQLSGLLLLTRQLRALRASEYFVLATVLLAMLAGAFEGRWLEESAAVLAVVSIGFICLRWKVLSNAMTPVQFR